VVLSTQMVRPAGAVATVTLTLLVPKLAVSLTGLFMVMASGLVELVVVPVHPEKL
jgi:hypothetical protein